MDNFENVVKPQLESDKDNKLILLGDYLDIYQNTAVLYTIKELQKQYLEQIVILVGNHELMFLKDIENCTLNFEDQEMIDWINNLPAYYETEDQIFVHAGVEEETGENWKWSPKSTFCNKYPYSIGEFYKDIVAGHVYISIIANDSNYHKVYWDFENHFYLMVKQKIVK